MATYRLIRILRAVLPVIVLILVGIPARNYWISRGRTPAVKAQPASPAADLAVHTVDLVYKRTEGARTVFVLKAKEHLFLKDNKHVLNDVNVVISGEKPGEFDRIISGTQCVYDIVTGDIHFTGNVKAQLDAKTAAQSEELLYSHADRVISSPVKTHIVQPGEMNGDSDEMKYSMTPELLLLTGNVVMQMSNGESLHTGVGEFQKKENWAAVSGGVYLEASNGWMKGTSGHADLTPETYRPTIVTIEGDVTSESHSANSPDTLATKSNSIVSVLSPAGEIQHVFARGDVEAKQTSKGELQTITGDEVEAKLDEHGHVETMEARQPKTPYAKMIGSGRSLTSDVIHISDVERTKSAGSIASSSTITTTEHSNLVAGDSSTISGRNFQIVQSDNLRFDTKSSATLVSTTKDGGKRKTTSDVTRAVINSKTNELESLTQTGHFTFDEGARKGSADQADISDGGNTIKLFGNFKFNESTRSGSSNRATISNGGNTIEMFESVKFTDGSRSGTAAHAILLNGGETTDLDNPAGSRATVKDSDKKLEVQARTIHLDQKTSGTQKTNGFDAKTDVITESRGQDEVVRVFAARAQSDGDLIQYTGNVDLYRGEATHIHADSITPDKNNGFKAIGNVKSQMEGMIASAQRLEYDDEKKTALYTGNVHATRKEDKKSPMTLDASDMTLLMDSGDAKQKGQLKEIKANGHVNVTQGLRAGTGDHLSYDYASDHLTLTSDPGAFVTMEDPQGSMGNGTRLDWTSESGKIINDRGGKVTSITKSIAKTK